VTFLITDVEGSTGLWAADAEVMSASLRMHDEMLRRVIDRRGGYVFATGGDSFCVAFQRASDAVESASAIQRALGEANWPGPSLRVRVGVHVGEAEERSGDYFGPAVNLAARVAAAGHGGQVLLTEAVRAASGVEAVDLGEHHLRDIPQPVWIWQIGSEEFPALRSVNARSNLPVFVTRMFGRDEDVRAVRLLLLEHRLVTLVAVGGSGKTRLAVAVGEEEMPHRRDGVWFADLTMSSDDADVGPAVAAALGLEVRSPDYTSEIARYLSGRELLLVLDNCEHVIDACAELAEAVLGAGGRTAILATSREWLDIDGERVYRVSTLEGEDPDSAAIRLFVDRAVATAPDFELDVDNFPYVADVCRRLDGLPLAIELAGSRAAVMSPRMLAEGLDDRFGLLSGGRRRRRRRTLEATIDWSYDLLESDEQQVLQRLGVFAGSFDVPAVAAVCELSESMATDIVESLVGRSLVAASDDAGRFRLLETLKAYAEHRLVDSGQLERTQELHAAHFSKLARIDSPLQVDDRVRLARLGVEQANLQLAADWLERVDHSDELAELLLSITPLYDTAAPAKLAQVHRALDNEPSARATDQLHLTELHLHIGAGDWSAYARAAKSLQRSTDEEYRAWGYLTLSLVAGRHRPDIAYGLVDRFAAAYGPDPSHEARLTATSWRCMVAASSNDLLVAQETAHQVHDLYRGDYLPGATEIALLVAGVMPWFEGEPAELSRTVAMLASVEMTDRRDYRLVDFASALVALSGNDSASVEAVRHYAAGVASGRMNLIETDALILLAELALREGDADIAVDLMRSTGAGRSPLSNLVGHQVAERLGVHDEIEQSYAKHLTDSHWLIERPKQALRAELLRRDWLRSG
jgi:predicted ATPase